MTEPTVTLTESQIKEIAAEAARSAVHQTLTELGFDVEKPLDAQADAQFLRGWRIATEEVKRHGLKAAVTVVVTGILGLIWTAVHVGGSK